MPKSCWQVSCDAVLISDYNKGVCTPALLRRVIAAARHQQQFHVEQRHVLQQQFQRRWRFMLPGFARHLEFHAGEFDGPASQLQLYRDQWNTNQRWWQHLVEFLNFDSLRVNAWRVGVVQSSDRPVDADAFRMLELFTRQYRGELRFVRNRAGHPEFGRDELLRPDESRLFLQIDDYRMTNNTSPPECDQFSDHRRAICRGERADLPLDGPSSINSYRVRWGLARLKERVADANSQPAIKSPAGQSAPISGTPTIVSAPPSLLQQVTTFAQAFTEHVKDGLAKCDDKQIQARLATCQPCPEFTGAHCRKCGCACNGRSTFFNKLAWRSERCPLGKWSAAIEFTDNRSQTTESL